MHNLLFCLTLPPLIALSAVASCDGPATDSALAAAVQPDDGISQGELEAMTDMFNKCARMPSVRGTGRFTLE